jgi:hypothetical protein
MSTNSPPVVRGLKSVILTSEQPAELAAFYRDVLMLPLEEERHRGTERHWACQLGDMHFAIHATGGFWLPVGGTGASSGTIVNFTIEDMAPMLAHLEARGVAVVARTKIGPMDFVALRDPDGRYVCCGTPWPSRAARVHGCDEAPRA